MSLTLEDSLEWRFTWLTWAHTSQPGNILLWPLLIEILLESVKVSYIFDTVSFNKQFCFKYKLSGNILGSYPGQNIK